MILDTYKYIGSSIRFNWSTFLFTDGSYGKSFIIFEADMSSSVYTDNKNKNILILSEGPPQGLYDTALTAESKYPINSTQQFLIC